MDKNRCVVWDYARGIAITMIVLYHLIGYADRVYASIPVSICHTAQIPIFMYVSGVLSVSTLKRYRWDSLLINKSIRLLFPFVSFTIIWGIIDPSGIIPMLLDQFKSGYWFVLVLFEIISVFALLNEIKMLLRISSLYVIVLFYCILSIYVYFVPNDFVINRLLSINLLWHYFPFFVIGFYSTKIAAIFCIRFSLLYFFIYACAQYYYFKTDNSVALLFCNFFSLAFYMSIFQGGVRPLVSVFSKIGVYSLQIYLIHYLLIELIVPHLPVLLNYYLDFSLLLVLVSIIIMFSIIISKFLMKNKILAMALFGVMKQR